MDIFLEKDYDPEGGETLLRDPERKFRLACIERTAEGKDILEHRALCEALYQYMHSLGFGMAVQIWYNGEGEVNETNGLDLYDYYDRYWDRYEVYARKLD